MKYKALFTHAVNVTFLWAAPLIFLMDTLTHRMDVQPILSVTINTMLSFDGHGEVTCKQTSILYLIFFRRDWTRTTWRTWSRRRCRRQPSSTLNWTGRGRRRGGPTSIYRPTWVISVYFLIVSARPKEEFAETLRVKSQKYFDKKSVNLQEKVHSCVRKRGCIV